MAEHTDSHVIITDKDAYNTLNIKLKKANDELDTYNKEYEYFCAQPDMVRITKYVKFVGNHCQLIPYSAFEQIDLNYYNKLSPLNTTIVGINKHIENLNKLILNVKHEITKLAELRDKQPNFDVAIIRDYELKIKKLEEEKKSIIQSVEKPEILKDYPTYIKYEYDGKIISREYNCHVNKVNPIKKLIVLLENEIQKELWNDRYNTYSHEHSLEVDEENIFRVCNNHWYEKNIDLAAAKNITKENIETNIGVIHTIA